LRKRRLCAFDYSNARLIQKGIRKGCIHLMLYENVSIVAALANVALDTGAEAGGNKFSVVRSRQGLTKSNGIASPIMI
jgi:hypothetical protein